MKTKQLSRDQIRFLTPLNLRWLYQKDKKTLKEISGLTGISPTGIRERLKEYGISKKRS